MKNINKISLLTLSFLLFGNNCFAQIKFDITSTVSSVTDEIGKVQEQAQDIMKQGEHMQTFLKMKDGLTEGLNKINDIKKQVMDVAGDIKGAVDDVKGAVEDAKGMVDDAKGALDDAKGMVNDAKDMANSAKDMAGGALQSAQGAVNNATGGLSQAKDMLQLQNKMAQAESNYQNRIQNLNAEKEAELQKLRENNEILQKMLAEAKGETFEPSAQVSENVVSNSALVSDRVLEQTASLSAEKALVAGEKITAAANKNQLDPISPKPAALDTSAKISSATTALSVNKSDMVLEPSIGKATVELNSVSLSAREPVAIKQNEVLTGVRPTVVTSQPVLNKASEVSVAPTAQSINKPDMRLEPSIGKAAVELNSVSVSVKEPVAVKQSETLTGVQPTTLVSQKTVPVLDKASEISVTADNLSINESDMRLEQTINNAPVELNSAFLSAEEPVAVKQTEILTNIQPTALTSQKILSSAPVLEKSVQDVVTPQTVTTLEKSTAPLNSSIISGVVNRKAFTQPLATQNVTGSIKVGGALQ